MSSQKSARKRVKPFGSLIAPIDGARVVGDAAVGITGLAYDSREVGPGFAFVAVLGEHVDGHSFVPAAVQKGALALIVEAGREAGISPPPGGALAVVPDTRAAMPVIAGRSMMIHQPI